MFCSNFHFNLKRNLDDESGEKEQLIKQAPHQPNLIWKKRWWDRCCRNFAREEFKNQVRIHRETFDIILNIVELHLTKEETNLSQHPISVNRQLGLTLYRLGHGASFTKLSQLCGVSISLASVTLPFITF